MDGPLRIMFIATDLSTGGGVNRIIRDLAVLLKQRLGAAITVIAARSDRPSSYLFPEDVPVETHRPQSLPSYFRLLVGLRRRHPDVVISSWAQDNILVALAFLFSSTRVILVEHASWHFQPWHIRALRRLTYPLASEVVVLNRRELAHYRRFLSRVRLIPNLVVASSEMSTGHREKLIVAIGHLSPLKNFADAIRAFASSRLEEEGWSLAIIGKGSEEQQLNELIAELKLTHAQIHAPTDDLASWYARASILLVTSRLESFSLVLAEAIQAGVIPIAYASDGPSFILEDFAEHLVPIGEAEILAQRLAAFAHDQDADLLRVQLRSAIASRFGPDVVAEQWRALLEAPPCQ